MAGVLTLHSKSSAKAPTKLRELLAEVATSRLREEVNDRRELTVPREILHKFETELRRCAVSEDIAPASFIQTVAKEVGVPAKSLPYALQYAHDLGLVIFPKLIGRNPKPLGTNRLPRN